MGNSEAPPRLSQVIDAGPLASTIAAAETPAAAAVGRGAEHAATPLPNEDVAAKSSSSSTFSGSPSRIGRYVLLRMLGQGGMGVVFAAYDEDLDRKVALKLLRPDFQADGDLRRRIVREAQALARVSAPNVVHVYEVGEIDEQMFIAMEFVNGMTLTRWQEAEPRTWQETLRMYTAAGQGLLAAHDAGLTHRDFKPDNVLVGSDGRPRVADFGVARVGSAALGGPVATKDRLDEDVLDLASTTPRLPGLTQDGMAVGTPLYMSPEQHMGESADSRCDQFSFCVALYEALYGQLPFAGKTVIALRANVVRGNILPRPATSKVPAPVHAALLRGLSTAADRRFPSMRELLTALSFDEASDPAAAPRERRRVTIGLLAFATFSTLAQISLRWLGLNQVKAALAVALVFFFCLSFLAFRFRRMLLNNAFHRVMIITSLVLAGEISGLRLIGVLRGLTLAQVLTVDLVALTAMSCMLSALALPSLWPLVPVAAVITLTAAWLQDYAVVIGQALIPTMIISAVVLWNRAAQKPAAKESGRSP